MRLLAAILATLAKSAMIVVALMALLFAGSLMITEAGPSVRQGLETPERLDELEEAGRDQTRTLARHQAHSTHHDARRLGLEIRLADEREGFEDRLDEQMRAIQEATEQQIDGIEQNLEDHVDALTESADRMRQEYCDSWNPVDWIACRTVRNRLDGVEDRADRQREAVAESARRMRREAHQEAMAHREQARERFDEETEALRDELQASLATLDELEDQRRDLETSLAEIERRHAQLRDDNWLWLQFRDRWPWLLTVALLIFTAPYIRRTLWYWAGMPLVSRAAPIELSEDHPPATPDSAPVVETGDADRTLQLDVPPGQRLLARTGYIQSDREDAKSELFFDRDAPNLSFISGLVLLTRLTSREPTETPRSVELATPDDPDAYLMRVDIRNHPGVVFRARHVVGVVGDVDIDSSWRLTNLHAWATSQIRFVTFSGTGTLIVEGHGDVRAHRLDGEREHKRMPLVIGFDTRLTYRTDRSATFLPYLVAPHRDPLVVDVFEGEGTVFFEKNPSARKQNRTVGEKIAGFFLDAFRRLLGL